MGKKKKPELKTYQKFIGTLPWHTDSKGNKYIDIGNNTFITPDTVITDAIKTQATNQVQADDVLFTINDNGICFYGTLNQPLPGMEQTSSMSVNELSKDNKDE